MKVEQTKRFNIVAVLAAIILPNDGAYDIQTIDNVDINNIPLYTNHPIIRNIATFAGAVPFESGTFKGLEVGETVIVFKTKKAEHLKVSEIAMENLEIRAITRIN